MRRISDLPDDEAAAALRACCGSERWVQRMLSQRPFRDRADVFDSAERIWWDLSEADWLEAFAGHPKIGGSGDRGIEKADQHATWSAAEQAGAAASPDDVKAALAKINAAYEARFGFIYIVCATGKTGEQMLELAYARLTNERDAELHVAALEQARITKLRLEKLLEL